MSGPTGIIRRLLVANRGEIALRVLRTAREMGIGTVAVYTGPDRAGIWREAADRSVCLGEAPGGYLDGAALIAAALQAGADAIHPGFGFLSERADFAQAVLDAGLRWVGPHPAAIRAMGDKVAARAAAAAAAVPVVPGGLPGEAGIGFPLLLLKAAGGGGGKGMRVVESAEELPDALAAAQAEALAAFGNPAVYAERLLRGARHVEVQVLGDRHGACVHLWTRDCSVQRRHQKIIEEAPAPALSDATRDGLHAAALRLAAAVGYDSAGTVEFLVAPDGSFYFLEMNTRIQVEHTVTEQITGLDLIREQIRIAEGAPLGFAQADVRCSGHAVQVRIYAEDPAAGFLPSPGTIRGWQMPEGPGVRVDAGVRAGSEVSVWYDPMLAKLVAWAPDRAAAIARMRRALSEVLVAGVESNVAFLDAVLAHPDFCQMRVHTGWIAAALPEWAPPPPDPLPVIAAFLFAEGAPGAGRAAQTAELSAAPSGPWEGLGGWRNA